MSDDDDFIEWIGEMDSDRLLTLVMENPEYLIDRYYMDFRRAIYKRYEELTK